MSEVNQWIYYAHRCLVKAEEKQDLNWSHEAKLALDKFFEEVKSE